MSNNLGNPQILETFDVSLFSYLSEKLPYTLYVGHIPQLAATPAYSYFQTDEEPSYTLRGNASGYSTVTYQIDCWDTDYLTISNMQRQLKDLLHGYHHGFMGSTRVWNSRITSNSINSENNSDQSGSWIYHGVSEFRISYLELVPDFNNY